MQVYKLGTLLQYLNFYIYSLPVTPSPPPPLSYLIPQLCKYSHQSFLYTLLLIYGYSLSSTTDYNNKFGSIQVKCGVPLNRPQP